MNPKAAIKNNDDGDYRHNLLKGAVARLDEHFDSVLIIASCSDTQRGSHLQYASRGNHYASIAGAERWVTKQKHDWVHHETDEE